MDLAYWSGFFFLHVDEPGLVAGSSAQGWMVQGEKFKCYYGVPLISKGNIEGVLELFHRDQLTPDLEWLDFLETLAGQLRPRSLSFRRRAPVEEGPRLGDRTGHLVLAVCGL